MGDARLGGQRFLVASPWDAGKKRRPVGIFRPPVLRLLDSEGAGFRLTNGERATPAEIWSSVRGHSRLDATTLKLLEYFYHTGTQGIFENTVGLH